MPAQALKQFLDSHGVRYITISHSPAFTATEVAATAHIPGKELAKTVMVKVDGVMAMAVLPSSCVIDFDLLTKATGARHVTLASEQDFKDKFPECEIGAMPPFGNLYGMQVFVAADLARDAEIAFNAGTHKELIKLQYADFERLVCPHVLAFCAS